MRLYFARFCVITKRKPKQAQSDHLRKKIKQIPAKIDISCLQDYRCFKRISNESKNLFDFVTSAVWNARKQMVEWILFFYENKNEYIDLFYAIRAHCPDAKENGPTYAQNI